MGQMSDRSSNRRELRVLGSFRNFAHRQEAVGSFRSFAHRQEAVGSFRNFAHRREAVGSFSDFGECYEPWVSPGFAPDRIEDRHRREGLRVRAALVGRLRCDGFRNATKSNLAGDVGPKFPEDVETHAYGERTAARFESWNNPALVPQDEEHR